MFIVCSRWGRYPVYDAGLWSRLALSLGQDDDESEFAAMGKPLALDACRQCRRADRGVLAQDHAAALRPIHPSAGRLSFRLYKTRPDWRGCLAVYGQGAGVAGVRAVWHGVAGDGRAVRPALPADVRF